MERIESQIMRGRLEREPEQRTMHLSCIQGLYSTHFSYHGVGI